MTKYTFSELLRVFEKSMGLKNDIKWATCIYIMLYHISGAVWCYYYAFPVKWQTLFYACAMYIVTGFGITGGAHRYWTHRSYKAKYPLQVILLLCVSSAGHYSVLQWVRDHRLHHKHSDTDADPHNAKRGFFFSHIGWLMLKKNDQVRQKGKEIDMSDLYGDPLLRFQHKHFGIIKLVLCFIIPSITGVLFWGEEWKCAVAWQCFIRYLTLLHGGLTVNSLAHTFGKRPYNAKILPTQNKFVSLVTFGEGWHNFHHTFPFDYKASETIDFLDFTTALIHFFGMLGWAYDMKQVSPNIIRIMAKKTGDESLLQVRDLKENNRVEG